ncbi:hypothetical protein AHiyo4_19840 [Arthrobacter sp. Hiyo4]|nr:hypothetical protein AHiyo4_19840 [Arthrobacter sp. Hiyo4]
MPWPDPPRPLPGTAESPNRRAGRAPAAATWQYRRARRLSRVHARPTPAAECLRLEEPVGPNAGCRTALGRVLGEGRHFRRTRSGPRQGAVRACNGDHHGVVVGGGDRPEEQHLVPGAELDAHHAAGRPALGPDIGGAETEQLSLTGQEHQIGLRRPGRRHTHHLVLVLERYDFPVLAVQGVIGLDPLDHTLGGADGQDFIQRGERHQRLTLQQRDEVLGRNTAGEVGQAGHRRQHRHVHDLKPQHPAL